MSPTCARRWPSSIRATWSLKSSRANLANAWAAASGRPARHAPMYPGTRNRSRRSPCAWLRAAPSSASSRPPAPARNSPPPRPMWRTSTLRRCTLRSRPRADRRGPLRIRPAPPLHLHLRLFRVLFAISLVTMAGTGGAMAESHHQSGRRQGAGQFSLHSAQHHHAVRLLRHAGDGRRRGPRRLSGFRNRHGRFPLPIPSERPATWRAGS